MSRRTLGRDKHVKTEWGEHTTRGAENHDFGYCDHGWKLQTGDEATVYAQLKADGWTVHKHGWPDFLAVKGNKVRVIEVKSNADKRRQSQIAVHEALRLLGIEVEVLLVDNPNRVSRYHTKPLPIKRQRS